MSNLQNPSVIAAFIGAIVSLVALVLNVLVSRRTQRIARFLEVTGSSLEFKKQQLNEFYGPLVALTMQNDTLASRLKDIYGKDFQLLDNLPQILQEPAVSSIVDLLLKNNAEIEKLLLTKSSLIEEKVYPIIISQFLGHCAILKSAASSQPLPVRKQEDYYPEKFDRYVEEQFERLKRDIDIIFQERSRLSFKRGKK